MKKILSFTFLSIILIHINLSSHSQFGGKSFHIKGKLQGKDSSYIHLTYINSNAKFQHDSSMLKDGRFEFKGNIAEPVIASLYGTRKKRSIEDPNFTELYIEPSLIEINLKTDSFKYAEVKGSLSQLEFRVYLNSIDSLEKRWGPMLDSLSKAKDQNDTKTIEEIYSHSFNLFSDARNNITYSFIKRFPGSYVSVTFLSYHVHNLTLDSLKAFYSFLTDVAKNSSKGKRISEFIKAAENVAIGKKAPDFNYPDINGKKISLGDFKGKYLLLDFWASWCIPCREEHPFLKQAYKKFRNTLEIVGVSLDRAEDKQQWQEAIKKDSLAWLQVCDFKVWNSEIIKNYNLVGKGIPANFLINPEGIIVAKDLRGDELYKKMDSVIK